MVAQQVSRRALRIVMIKRSSILYIISLESGILARRLLPSKSVKKNQATNRFAKTHKDSGSQLRPLSTAYPQAPRSTRDLRLLIRRDRAHALESRIRRKEPRTTALLGHFALRAPSRRVWRVDFGVMEWGVMRAAIPLGCCVVGVAES